MRNAQTFLHMKTPPLRVGDVLFTYGNVAARTFGRAHRHRPYHFSCGSVSQDCRRGVRRQAKMRKVTWQRGSMEAGRSVPACPTVSPCEGASIGKCTNMFWYEHTSFMNGNGSFAGGGRALCGWKRRCADVRAGTQAPPLPFLMWLRVIKLPENNSPHHKHKCIVVESCSPLHKHE